jgi:hypothetical protein
MAVGDAVAMGGAGEAGEPPPPPPPPGDGIGAGGALDDGAPQAANNSDTVKAGPSNFGIVSFSFLAR